MRGARGRRVPPTVVRVAAAIALVVGCIAGGVAATTLFPSTVETINYRAQLRLSINAEDASQINSPTIFGNINLHFDGPGPAPGILAGVQVKPNITDLLAQPKVSIKALQPSRLELSNAAGDAVIALGLRFAAGSLAVTLLAVGAYAAWRHGRPPARRLAAAGACWVFACGVTGVSIWQTYQPDRLGEFTTTGILGAVQRNADLLEGVETRAQQTTPYLKNLLALSAALQDKYTPQSLGEPVAARILLVSDIHGGQQYPLMRTIVREEHIDAVIDLGDLLNFGQVAEGTRWACSRASSPWGCPTSSSGATTTPLEPVTPPCCAGWPGCPMSCCSSRTSRPTSSRASTGSASRGSTTRGGSATTTTTTPPSRSRPPRPSPQRSPTGRRPTWSCPTSQERSGT